MKKIIIAFLLITCFAFTTNEQKALNVSATQNEWAKHIQKLEVIRAIADESNLSNQQVKFITKTIDSIEMLIVPQLQKQIADTTKKK